MSELNDKQRRFVEEYLVDLNASQAAVRAGYRDPKTGPRLLVRPAVAQAVAQAQEERSRRVGLRQDWVLENLQRIVERCLQAEEVCDKKGEPTGVFRFDPAGANRALEIIGKHLNMFGAKNEEPRAGGPLVVNIVEQED
ncbi:MAG: terminase small subunit [Deltaproteobacteria bacterium]|nr:terminase small subunit [Deltaproteobacteria bacterium]